MLTQPIQELIGRLEALRAEESDVKDGAVPLDSNELVSSAAAFYEKVRYLIDYREEHTIRRSAIERILRRRVLIEEKLADGEELLKELVEGQYLSQDELTEEAIQRSTEIIKRFSILYKHSSRSAGLIRRILSFAATEIERSFVSRDRAVDEAVADALYQTVRPSASIVGFSERETDVQLFCACRRSLYSADNETLAYALWLRYVPEWREGGDVAELAAKLPSVLASIEEDVRNPMQWQLVQKIKDESIYFHIIRELVRQKNGSAEWILSTPSELEKFTRHFLGEQYHKEQARLQASGVRAVTYLFFTKFLAALAFELPYEVFVLGGVHYVPLFTNLIFHPLLLLGTTRGVSSLNDANTDAIMTGMRECLTKGKVRAVKIASPHTVTASIFGLVYFLLILLLFAGLIGVLGALDFNVVSIALFMLFLALVSYFAFRIRYNAQRWRVTGKESSLSIITHVLAVPIVRVGRWLSRTFSSVNVVVLFMDFIIETPFKLLLSFSRQFVVYLREKANDVY